MDTSVVRRRKTVTKTLALNEQEKNQLNESSATIDNFSMASDLNLIQEWSPNPLAYADSLAKNSNQSNILNPSTSHPHMVKHQSIVQLPGIHLNYAYNKEKTNANSNTSLKELVSDSKASNASLFRPKSKTANEPPPQPKRWLSRNKTTIGSDDPEFTAEQTLYYYVSNKMHPGTHNELSIDEQAEFSKPELRQSYSKEPLKPGANNQLNTNPNRGARSSILKNASSKNRLRKLCTKFKQQDITGHYFLPSSKCVMTCKLVLGLLLLVVGGIVMAVSNTVVEIDLQYGSSCSINTQCEYPFTVSNDVSGPVFVYLKITNFFQNHQRYVKSVDSSQLAGNDVSLGSLSSCSPIETADDLEPTQQYSLNGDPLNSSVVANPCGLIAKSYFTDQFNISDQNNNSVPISYTNIAWSVDRDDNFKRNPNYLQTQWTDVEDGIVKYFKLKIIRVTERFMNWMNFATLPDWKKLWGRIDSNLAADYNVSGFSGGKTLSLSTISFFGGTRLMLAITFLSLGGIYLCIAIIVLILVKLKRVEDYKIHQEINFDWSH